MKYIVKYRDVEIGIYETNEHGASYIINENGLKKLEDDGYDLFIDLKENSNIPIPLFENRIKNCSRFGGRISYHTDAIELVEIK